MNLDLFDPAEGQRLKERGKAKAARHPHFDGETYEPALDHARLTSQLGRVREVMRDGQWRTLHDILAAVDGASEASISARLRDLRKEKFGLHRVERRRVAGGLFEYRLELKT